MDLHEDPQTNTMTALFELPRVSRENAQIGMQNDILSMAGECKEKGKRDESGYMVHECRYGKFSRGIAPSECNRVHSGQFSCGSIGPDAIFCHRARSHQGQYARRRCHCGVPVAKSTPETVPKRNAIS